ncbi:MAG: hypothetical protein ACP5SH_04040 [Syntrophobacteraceae bacterium]
MATTKSFIVTAVLAAALLAVGASPPKYFDPPSPCLMVPGTHQGQGNNAEKGDVPKSCVA